MAQTAITFIIDGKTYRIAADKPDAIRHIPKADREQLIELLEVVKLQDRLSTSAVEQATAKALAPDRKLAAGQNIASATNSPSATQTPPPERLSHNDVDDLMARLIREEKKNKKPGITQATIYKWAAAIIAVIFILVVFT